MQRLFWDEVWCFTGIIMFDLGVEQLCTLLGICLVRLIQRYTPVKSRECGITGADPRDLWASFRVPVPWSRESMHCIQCQVHILECMLSGELYDSSAQSFAILQWHTTKVKGRCFVVFGIGFLQRYRIAHNVRLAALHCALIRVSRNSMHAYVLSNLIVLSWKHETCGWWLYTQNLNQDRQSLSDLSCWGHFFATYLPSYASRQVNYVWWLGLKFSRFCRSDCLAKPCGWFWLDWLTLALRNRETSVCVTNAESKNGLFVPHRSLLMQCVRPSVSDWVELRALCAKVGNVCLCLTFSWPHATHLMFDQGAHWLKRW